MHQPIPSLPQAYWNQYFFLPFWYLFYFIYLPLTYSMTMGSSKGGEGKWEWKDTGTWGILRYEETLVWHTHQTLNLFVRRGSPSQSKQNRYQMGMLCSVLPSNFKQQDANFLFVNVIEILIRNDENSVRGILLYQVVALNILWMTRSEGHLLLLSIIYCTESRP